MAHLKKQSCLELELALHFSFQPWVPLALPYMKPNLKLKFLLNILRNAIFPPQGRVTISSLN